MYWIWFTLKITDLTVSQFLSYNCQLTLISKYSWSLLYYYLYYRACAHTCACIQRFLCSCTASLTGTRLFLPDVTIPRCDKSLECTRRCSVLCCGCACALMAVGGAIGIYTRTHTRTHLCRASCNRLASLPSSWHPPKPRQQLSCTVDMARKYRNNFLKKDGKLPSLLE